MSLIIIIIFITIIILLLASWSEELELKFNFICSKHILEANNIIIKSHTSQRLLDEKWWVLLITKLSNPYRD